MLGNFKVCLYEIVNNFDNTHFTLYIRALKRDLCFMLSI